MINFFKNSYFWLFLIIILAFVTRLYKIDSPIADWHSWRQADTAAVTRNFIKEGFNPFLPKGDDISGISEESVVNANRLRFVEFPVYNIITYPFYLIFGVNEQYSRLVSVIFSLGSVVFLYFISKRYLGTKISLLITLIYSILPFNVFFSRTTLPEPTFLFFALGMIYFVDNWIWKNKLSFMIFGFIFTSIAFLIKPWAIFFFLPLIYSVICRYSISKIPKRFFVFTILALIPFIFWRFWILQQPAGIPASSWLLNGDHIRFKFAFWKWIISDRIGGEILGTTGLVLFVIGILKKPKDGNYFMHTWLLSMFLYFVIFATGNVRHNYYQYIFVPIGVVFLTKGFVVLISGIEGFVSRIFTIVLALLFLPLTFYTTWLHVKEFYNVNNQAMIQAGKEADRILPKDAVVVAPYNGDTAFLYQINRSGWPVVPTSIKDLIADYGVGYFISTSKDDKTNWVLRHFQTLENNSDFIIADLQNIKVPLKNDPEP